MVHERRLDHATAVRAETRAVFAEARTLVSSRFAFAAEQLEEMQALQGKNQKLVEVLARKAGVERGRLEQARAMMMGLRTVHNRHADELARLLDPNTVRASGIEARVAVLNSPFSGGIGEALDGFLHQVRERMQGAIAVIDEARTLMGNVSRKFTEEFHIPTVESPRFATDRFLLELDRLEERCERDFKGASSLLLRRRKTLGALFFDTVALKVDPRLRDRRPRGAHLDERLHPPARRADQRLPGAGEQPHRRDGTDPERGHRPGGDAWRSCARSGPTWPRSASSTRRTASACSALLDVEREPSLA